MKEPAVLRLLQPLTFFNTRRTREIFNVNPTSAPIRAEANKVDIHVFDFNSQTLEEKNFLTVEDCFHYRDNQHVTWINIDGIRKADVEAI